MNLKVIVEQMLFDTIVEKELFDRYYRGYKLILFFSSYSNIHTLSLRSCGITSVGATMLGYALFKNKSLVTLDLCNNKIGSEGAKALAMVINRCIV